MRIIHIALGIQNSATWNALLVTANGNLSLPSFSKFYLLSANCKLSVRDSGNKQWKFMGSDIWGWDPATTTTFEKIQGYDADVELRNSNTNYKITPQEVTYTAVTGTQESINEKLFINPMGMYIPREPIPLNLNPLYTLGVQSTVRWSWVNPTTPYSTLDVYAYTEMILELGCE